MKSGFKFSDVSKRRLSSCHEDLQLVVNMVMKRQIMDFSVLCGHRGKRDQNKAVAEGRSKDPWPESHHNEEPSLAVDLAAYPIRGFDDYNSRMTCKLAGLVLYEADLRGIPITWGGHWERFPDIYHFQLPRGYE